MSKNIDQVITRKALRSALKQWNSSQKLGRHALASLSIVDVRRRAAAYTDIESGLGMALRDVLQNAIDRLRPDDGEPEPSDRRWRPYIIIYGQFVEGRMPGYLTEQMGIARSTYNHEQATTLDVLAGILQQMEQNHSQVRPAMTSIIPRSMHFGGREDELAYFLGQLNTRQVAVVTGMPGIGKTALGAEIAARQQSAGLDVFWMSFGEGINTDIGSLLRELGVFLSELGREELWSFLELESKAEQQYPLHTKIQRLIRVLEEGTYTLCFDNFDLIADDRDLNTFFEVLRERAMHGRAIHLLIMSQQKPAVTADVELRPLGGLSLADAEALLRELGLIQFPAHLVKKLYAVTRGHPIFLQLFSAWIVKSGLAAPETESDALQVKQFLDGMDQAPDIETYLLMRVNNALSQEEQQMAELMSVFRLPFDDRSEPIIEIFMGEGVANPALEQSSLVRKHIVTRVGGSGAIEFQPLLRLYFYNRLRGHLPLKRRLHLRVAEFYEAFQEEYLEAAYHYRESGSFDRSISLLDKNYRQLIGSGKAQRLLEILTPVRRQQAPASVWLSAVAIRGHAFAFLGDYEAALACFDEALNGYTQRNMSEEEQRRAADIAQYIGRLHGRRGDYREANERMEQAVQLLGSVNSDADQALYASIHANTAHLYIRQGRLADAEQSCHRALALLGIRDSGPVGARIHHMLGVIYQQMGRWTEAVDWLNKSLLSWEKIDDLHHVAQVKDDLGELYFYLGDLTLAGRYAKENLAFWREVGARDNAGSARLNLGRIWLVRGRLEQAGSYFTQALMAGQQGGNQELIGLAYLSLGFLDLARESYEDAREYLEQSLSVVATAEGCRGLSEAALSLKDYDQALRYAQQALTRTREQGIPFHEALSLRTLGRIYCILDDSEPARQYLMDSLQILEQLGAVYEQGRTLFQMARLETSLARGKLAQSHAGQAMAIFDSIGASVQLQQVRRFISGEPSLQTNFTDRVPVPVR